MSQHPIALLRDGFMNLLSGLGMANPKQAANGYAHTLTNVIELEAAFRTSTWFGKIVDIPADDAVRMGRQWMAKKEQIQLIEAEEKRLGVYSILRQAIQWQRLYGGAGVLIGTPGLLSQPLDLNKAGKGSLNFITVLPRSRLQGHGRNVDPLSPWFNLPEYYKIGNIDVHPSRVVRFSGPITDSMQGAGDGWGDSVFERLRDAITNADLGASVVGALLIDAKTDIYKIKNMMQNLATDEYTQLMIKRLQGVQTIASVTGAKLMDGDDEFEQKQITWTGLPDVVKVLLVILAGAADIPATRLLGTAASGLNATGEGDLKNYYDMVKTKQELEISPSIKTLDEMIIRSALGARDPAIWYEWRPLWQPTYKEKAEVNKMNADSDNVYGNSGLVPQDALAKAVQNRMIESGNYPGLEDALKTSNGILEKPDPRSDDLDEVDVTDAEPQTLYVRRDVINKKEITDWAKAQGFADIMPDLHVTIIYSTTPVDWMKAGQDGYGWGDAKGELTIAPGGPRMVEALGTEGQYKALTFASSSLSWRHEEIIRNTGASFDWEYYQPHITITRGVMPANVEPYRGKIVLGPEVFEKIRD